MTGTITPATLGLKIRRLREAKGLSRALLARKIGVDVSSIAGWESGKRLPRDTVRNKLARTLDCPLDELMSPHLDSWEPARVALFDVSEEYPAVFADCARKAKKIIRCTRLSSPYSTTCNIQTEGRRIIGERLLKGDLMVQRVEIFYTLERLKEVLHNILIYDGKPYYAQAYCIGLKEIAPFVGAWCFDDIDILVGGYWRGFPPLAQPVMRISGPPVKSFFLAYWKEIWEHGTMLNVRGARDLSAVRKTALAMGLPARRWARFVEEARALEIGDGAPPFV